MTDYTANFQELLDTAPASAWVDGGAWYANAKALAIDLAYQHDTTLEVTASVLSAFSPRTRWAENVAYAQSFLATGKAKTLGAHVVKAQRALTDGLDVFHPKTGLKTWSFARNIMGDLEPVTIDGWMVKASKHQLPPSKKLALGAYNRIADSVVELANHYHIDNANMQAVLWVAYRGSAD